MSSDPASSVRSRCDEVPHSGEASGAVLGPNQSVGLARQPADLTAIVFQPLHQVAMQLSGTLTIVDPPAVSRLQHAIAQIDQVIADVRAAAAKKPCDPC